MARRRFKSRHNPFTRHGRYIGQQATEFGIVDRLSFSQEPIDLVRKPPIGLVEEHDVGSSLPNRTRHTERQRCPEGRHCDHSAIWRQRFERQHRIKARFGLWLERRSVKIEWSKRKIDNGVGQGGEFAMVKQPPGAIELVNHSCSPNPKSQCFAEERFVVDDGDAEGAHWIDAIMRSD